MGSLSRGNSSGNDSLQAGRSFLRCLLSFSMQLKSISAYLWAAQTSTAWILEPVIRVNGGVLINVQNADSCHSSVDHSVRPLWFDARVHLLARLQFNVLSLILTLPSFPRVSYCSTRGLGLLWLWRLWTSRLIDSFLAIGSTILSAFPLILSQTDWIGPLSPDRMHRCCELN